MDGVGKFEGGIIFGIYQVSVEMGNLVDWRELWRKKKNDAVNVLELKVNFTKPTPEKEKIQNSFHHL